MGADRPSEAHLHFRPHTEEHFTAGAVVRDVVIGMSDGLTVPFALAAGISGAVASTHLVVTAGLAEVAAGSIAMGLGGYLAARGDAEHYDRERRREEAEVIERQDAERAEVVDILADYGVEGDAALAVLAALERQPSSWVDFMMRFELGLERPSPRRALGSAATIGGAYVVGGLFPLLPYMLVADASRALLLSIVLTLSALLAFGFVKGRFSGAPALRSAFQTAVIGSIAAAAAFGLARLFA
jgi:VIT1/CCC1 family predicted Fe2+/Mn2+ transporter